nr:MAG TPA: hypothetical protein [Caudoviricetes sp.]
MKKFDAQCARVKLLLPLPLQIWPRKKCASDLG